MKVNEKLSLVSIDLPDSFSHEFIRAIEPLSQQSPTISRFETIEFETIGFLQGHGFRVEYFLVRVVFRYEDAKVGGGKTAIEFLNETSLHENAVQESIYEKYPHERTHARILRCRPAQRLRRAVTVKKKKWHTIDTEILGSLTK